MKQIFLLAALFCVGCLENNPVVKSYYLGESLGKDGSQVITRLDDKLQVTIYRIDEHKDGKKDCKALLTVNP